MQLNKKNSLALNISQKDKIFLLLIFLNWMMYENLVLLEPMYFGGAILLAFVFMYKLLFPFVLVFSYGLPPIKFMLNARVFFYLSFFLLLVCWSVIPSLLYGDVVSWFKIIPLFIFFFGVLSFFYLNPECFLLFIKILVVYVLIALIQYCLINIFKTYESSRPHSMDLVGPFGLFGNTASKIGFPDNGGVMYIVRLTGFWKEPSNAAGSAFAAFFLTKYLQVFDNSKKWKYASNLCLIAGFLTLSNAGYLSISIAFLFGFMLRTKTRKWKLQVLIVTPILILLIWFALFSRTYFADQGIDSNVLKAVTGIRNQDVNDVNYDPTSGRLDLMNDAINQTAKNIIGRGLQVTGEATGVVAPASAPMFWLFLTGIPGLLFLLLREASLFAFIPETLKSEKSTLFLIQALIAVMIQQAIYGTWMDPNYLILSAVVLLPLSNRKLLGV